MRPNVRLLPLQRLFAATAAVVLALAPQAALAQFGQGIEGWAGECAAGQARGRGFHVVNRCEFPVTFMFCAKPPERGCTVGDFTQFTGVLPAGYEVRAIVPLYMDWAGAVFACKAPLSAVTIWVSDQTGKQMQEFACK